MSGGLNQDFEFKKKMMTMERERPCAMFDKRYQVSVPFFTVKKNLSRVCFQIFFPNIFLVFQIYLYGRIYVPSITSKHT